MTWFLPFVSAIFPLAFCLTNNNRVVEWTLLPARSRVPFSIIGGPENSQDVDRTGPRAK